MSTFFHKKVVTPFAVLLIAVLCAAASAGGTYLLLRGPAAEVAAPTAQALYALAVKDAAFADEDEILPLVEVTKDSELMTWNEAGDRVLLVSWHRYPDSYPAGEEVTLQWGEVWAFSGKEMARRYRAEKGSVADWTLRFEQLIGLPPACGYTHFSAFWVDPDDVIRPAFATDAAAQVATATVENPSGGSLSEWYAEWFDGNILASYFQGAYPWTRLGYTYDWADNGTEYGLTEFLILPDSKATVEFTLPTEGFESWLNSQRPE